MLKLLTTTAALLTLLASPQAHTQAAQLDAEQQAFVDELVTEHDFNAERLTELLATAEPNQAILDAIQRPWEAKPWHQYHPIFLTDKRLQAGLKFWQQHAEALNQAEHEFGVPAEVIVAIIGVETFYGSYLGNYQVLDALYTLGFHYPRRSSFFRSELKEFMLLTREEGLPVDEIKGSYAGAMGYGQFISSSYRHYAIDFDGDGVRDLLTNPVDAIGSVANYFVRNGWHANEAVAIELPTNSANATLASDGLKLTSTVAELVNDGLVLPQNSNIAPDQKAKVFRFEQPDDADYWLGLHNFYVITRYNRSPLYAMVVHQFSQQLAAAR
ncbi:Membrane-bound lytic murein transglycosylase B [Pseudidiomarina piscicola]|uniref:Membrane-bound lytic murein transglycosylase B n=1 Tax=Pseudidiomarina piscicola TaxID=2614830 RepID=A0A6S6WPQ7_9GAMM|nr:lytic murein transglycosylase B [Pseudidiomarina piscicola]CAB0149609.1 Membrane-bound lytic murein transglycosylase B [Pseudidiomarina piscicola]VZT39057.1 Membrane-bound lytic murein transglycosylase B [Pseudomonas aeruginosa]